MNGGEEIANLVGGKFAMIGGLEAFCFRLHRTQLLITDLTKLLKVFNMDVAVAQADRPSIHFEIETPSGTSMLPCCDPFANGFAL